jgi:transcriptional antiterminator RfaH
VKRWYLVFSKPRKELVADDNLKRQGYETYLPLLAKTDRRRERRGMASEPLFPRYLLVRLMPGYDNMGPIRSTIGVSGLVRFNDEPAVVADAIVDSLKRMADVDTGLHSVRRPALVRGDSVVIDEGPLAGVQAIFLAESGEERVVILLNMLGRENRMSVERRLLRSA